MSRRNVVRDRGAELLDLEACKACFADIAARLKLGKLTEAEADAARLALLTRVRPTNGQDVPVGSQGFVEAFRTLPHPFIAAAAIFVLVSGIGATTLLWYEAPDATGSREVTAVESSDDEVSRLTDYARSIGSEPTASAHAAGKLPDVDTMIERLAARLETAPQDVDGWTMLGRSYVHTERFTEAVTAFARAIELDPNSDGLKRAYEDAKAKAAESGNPETKSSAHQAAVTTANGHAATGPLPALEPQLEQQAAIRSMVDGLARRLEKSPRDLEGWTSLMRSRVVLGEKDVAATALRTALAAFADDPAASAQLTAAATELGLEAK